MRVPVGLVAGLGIAMAAAVPAIAQTAQPPSPMPIVALGMTLPEYQGLGCLAGGAAGAVGVFASITVATAGVLNPVLLATGFAVGCSVGSTVSPTFLWIGKAFGGH
jgi:hypothetical protein